MFFHLGIGELNGGEAEEDWVAVAAVLRSLLPLLLHTLRLDRLKK